MSGLIQVLFVRVYRICFISFSGLIVNHEFESLLDISDIIFSSITNDDIFHCSMAHIGYESLPDIFLYHCLG